MKKVVFPTGSWKLVDVKDFVKGQLDFDKLFLKMANRYNIPNANKCCPINPENLPVRYNKTEAQMEYFDDETLTWTVLPE